MIPGRYRIEFREAGIWYDIDGADSFKRACQLVSYYIYNLGHRENQYQITGPSGTINKNEEEWSDAQKESYWNSLIDFKIFEK